MTTLLSPRVSGVLLVLVVFVSISMTTAAFPLGKRLYRSLPSVSDDHYSEVFPDGTYKYAYTGENRYAAERKKRDGQVEGETLYYRPDGVPVKVHYYADKHGYRPKTEILYSDRILTSRRTVVPAVSGVIYPAPSGSSHVRLSNADNGNDVVVGSSNGGDVAVAQPQVTAIVGPGGHADIRPEAVARTDSGNRYFRSGGGNGDVAVANPSVHAIVGPGASVSIAPRATALTGAASEPVYREYVRSPTTYVREVPVPVPVHVPVPERRLTYVPPARTVPVVHHVPLPVVPVARAHEVLVVPPRPSYSYEYAYSSPDEKHPAYGPNSAYVNVRVNQKK